MTGPELRLEEALCLFEDIGFIHTAFARLERVHPGMVKMNRTAEPWHRYAGALRGLMLGAVRGVTTQASPTLKALMGDRYARALYSWCRDSRRIFKLSPDLQLLLGATDIDRVSVFDIALPFETFAITLPQPIVAPDGMAYDLIMLMREWSVDGSRAMLTVQVYPTAMAGYRSISQFDRRRLLRFVERPRDARRAAEAIVKFTNGLDRRADVCSSSIGAGEFEGPNAPVLSDGSIRSVTQYMCESFSERFGPAGHALAEAFRLGLGFCLYLDMCASDGRTHELLSGLPVPKALRGPRLVTDRAEVCLVQSMHTLSPQEREAFASSSLARSESSPHFRRGYWSRPPGKGDDPDAVKTVWHRPTIVRRDRLLENTLPIGSQSRVK